MGCEVPWGSSIVEDSEGGTVAASEKSMVCSNDWSAVRTKSICKLSSPTDSQCLEHSPCDSLKEGANIQD